MAHVRPEALVQSALRASDQGVGDSENAALHGVAVKTIRRWRREYQRRGRPRGQLHTAVACPRCQGADLDEDAYAELFGWYLGDGHITSSKRGVFDLHIYNDSRYEDLNKRVATLMRRVKPGGRPHSREVPGCVNTTMSWKHWPCLFPQHGPGRKHTRSIELQRWQAELLRGHAAPFTRGLFHSDGCRVTNWTVRHLVTGPKRYEYPRYCFSNQSTDIIGLCTWALDQVGVSWTLPRVNCVSVARRESVAVLDGIVGPKS